MAGGDTGPVLRALSSLQAVLAGDDRGMPLLQVAVPVQADRATIGPLVPRIEAGI
jgi:hypothetical protein